MINKIKIVLLMLFAVNAATAQILTPARINAGGVSSSNGNILLEYSVGGLFVTTINTATFMYTQDFLQPDKGTAAGVTYIVDVNLYSNRVFDAAGTTFTNGNMMLEFSLGELASITLNSSNNMLTQGVLQPLNISAPLPVTGLEFYAKRVDAGRVILDWTTTQEINNRGFHLERKKENETNFAAIGFVPTDANGGNSPFPLQYSKLDDNNFTGKTYYRLKQEDMDGSNTYSVIRIVNGNTGKQTAMQVWPIPATGPVNVLVNGLTKKDVLTVYDMAGKIIKQQTIQDNSPVQLLQLTPGTYIIRLAENKDLLQKIIVQ